VRSKVNPIIEKNPVIQETLIGMTDNIYQKQVGESFIFYQGTKGQSKGIMITSDINFHDELDRSRHWQGGDLSFQVGAFAIQGGMDFFQTPAVPI